MELGDPRVWEFKCPTVTRGLFSFIHEKHRISGDIVEYRVKTSRLPELHLGDTERGTRDIQNAIWCSYGHLIYREKIIKCVRRGVTSLIGRSGPVDICK